MEHRILVIEDDQDIAQLVALHLRDQGYEVILAGDGNSGLEQAQNRSWDLIILDLALPGRDGLEICRTLRSHSDYTPLLMLTAKSSELDRVLGFEIGADDYVTKPFSIRELMARVKALFRRIDALSSAESPAREKIIETGELLIDPAKRRVSKAGRPIALTAMEFDLLLQFARHPGRAYSRSQLLDLVWGYGHDSYEHTVNSHINRLRSKIEDDPSKPKYILTMWGVGYRFFDPEEAPEA